MSSEPAAPVEAWRYRELIVEGAIDMAHGGGQWHDMLYLPHAGVVAWIVWQEWDVQADARMHAHFEVPDESLSKAVRTEIPHDLAERIVDLAHKAAEHNVLARQLARDAVAARALGGRDTVKHRDDEPPQPNRR